MSYCKGVITRVVQHGGCLEVTVSGESPGSFPIDNCCAWAILDTEGTDWVGRPVEYADGFMRFLDEVPDDDVCRGPRILSHS